MAGKPVGIQFFTDGESSFFGTVTKANDLIKGFGDQLIATSDQTSAFGQVVIGVLRGAGAQVAEFAMRGADALKGMVQQGLDANAAFEQTEVAFTTLLGSGQAAQAFLDDLRGFAASTPFEFPELTDASRRLLAFGFTAEEIIPMLTSVGDAVGALGGQAPEVQRVIFALGQMQAKGRVANEELMQMAELGLPVYDILGKAFNKTTPEIQKMVSDGLLPAGKGIDALTAGFSELYGGSMKAQSATFNGLMSTLKDNISLALQAFTGPMFEQAKRVLVVLGNAVSNPKFAEFAGIIGSKVGSALEKVVDLGIGAVEVFNDLSGSMGDWLAGFAPMLSEARAWGANIVNQLAAGMWDAVGYVVSILQQIGGIIASWLAPGSPPKLLPDLPDWGQNAIDYFFQGMGQPSLDIFSDLASTIEGQLRELVKTGDVSEDGVFELIFGSRSAIASAVSEFETAGSVSEETFDKIRSSAGSAGDQVVDFARSYFDLQKATEDVAQAQKELNDITEAYDAILAPLNAQLQDIRDRKQALTDAEREKKLQEEIASGKLEGNELAQAQLELEEMAVEKQIKAAEKEKKSAVDLAETKLDAAKKVQDAAAAQLQLQQTQVKLQQDQNRLIQEQIGLLQKQAEAAARAASAGGGGGGGGAGGAGSPLAGLAGALGGAAKPEDKADGKPKLDSTTLINAAIETQLAIAETTGRILVMKQAITDFFVPITQVFDAIHDGIGGLEEGGLTGFLGSFVLSLQEAGVNARGFYEALLPWATVLDAIPGFLEPIFAFVDQFIDLRDIAAALGSVLVGQVAMGIASFVGGLALASAPLLGLIALSTAIHLAWQADFGGIQETVMSVLGSIWGFISTVGGQILAFWNENGAQILSTVQTQWEPIGLEIQGVMAVISEIVGNVLSTITQFWSDHGAQIMEKATTTFLTISDIVSKTIQFVLEVVTGTLKAINDLFTSDWDELKGITDGAWQALWGVIDGALALIQGTVTVVLDIMHGDFDQAWEDLKKMSADFVLALGDIFQGLWKMIQPGIQKAWDNFLASAKQIGEDIVKGIIQGITGNATALFNSLKNLATDALASAKDAIDGHSPSRLFAAEIGLPIAQGVGVGILGGTGFVLDSLSQFFGDISNTAVDEAQQLAEKVAKTLSDALNSQLEGLQNFAGGKSKNLDLYNSIVPNPTALRKAESDLEKVRKERQALQTEIGSAGTSSNLIRMQIEKLDQQTRMATSLDEYNELLGARTELEKELDSIQTDATSKGQKYAELQKQELELQQRQSEEYDLYIWKHNKAAEAKERLAKVQARATEISKTDAKAASEYLDFYSSQIDQEYKLRTKLQEAAITGNDTSILQEQLDLLLQQQQIGSTIFSRKQQQEADERRKALVEAANDANKLIGSIVVNQAEFQNKGLSIIQGIGVGMQQGLPSLQGILGQTVNYIVDTLKQGLGIHSPSSLMADLIGDPLGEGIIVGAEQTLLDLPDRMARAIQVGASYLAKPGRLGMPMVSSQAGSGGGTYVTNSPQTNYNYSPTYSGGAPAPSQNFRIMEVFTS